jgi:hypothetical protein
MPKLKNIKSLTIIFLVLLVFSTILASLIIPIYISPKDRIIKEINEGTALSGDGVERIKGGWDEYVTETGKKEIVLTSFNLFNPVYSMITQRRVGSPKINVQIIYLQRSGINKFNIDTTKVWFSTIKNTTFQEAIQIAKTHDLSKNNPDPENITVFEPPTEEEIQERRESEDIMDFKINNPEFGLKMQECLDRELGRRFTEEDSLNSEYFGLVDKCDKEAEVYFNLR